MTYLKLTRPKVNARQGKGHPVFYVTLAYFYFCFIVFYHGFLLL